MRLIILSLIYMMGMCEDFKTVDIGLWTPAPLVRTEWYEIGTMPDDSKVFKSVYIPRFVVEFSGKKVTQYLIKSEKPTAGQVVKSLVYVTDNGNISYDISLTDVKYEISQHSALTLVVTEIRNGKSQYSILSNKQFLDSFGDKFDEKVKVIDNFIKIINDVYVTK